MTTINFMNHHIAVVIPAYRCERQIENVITGLPAFVRSIVVVDDCSPDQMVAIVERLMARDPRIHLVRHALNTGVGGAMLDGYALACQLGAEVIVKLDSDDQMDPAFIKSLVRPILQGQADYTKGNRFLHASKLKVMPPLRRIGNLGLSFLTKVSSGCWNVFDPTNGFTAIHAAIVPLIEPSHIHRRYFFESSMLGEMRLIKAVVKDIYIPPRYAGEVSSLSELDSFFRFPPLLLKGLIKRILVEYFVRDFTPVSLFLVTSLPFILFGLLFGSYHWAISIMENRPATTGTVMLATLPFIIGVQLLLQSFVMDINNTPTKPIHRIIKEELEPEETRLEPIL